MLDVPDRSISVVMDLQEREWDMDNKLKALFIGFILLVASVAQADMQLAFMPGILAGGRVCTGGLGTVSVSGGSGYYEGDQLTVFSGYVDGTIQISIGANPYPCINATVLTAGSGYMVGSQYNTGGGGGGGCIVTVTSIVSPSCN